jgi:hypothetical protein
MSLEIQQRSVRRHHNERLKKKRLSYWGGVAQSDDRRLGILLHTPHPCTCWMCGNPRKFNKEITVQELKHLGEPTDY